MSNFIEQLRRSSSVMKGLQQLHNSLHKVLRFKRGRGSLWGLSDASNSCTAAISWLLTVRRMMNSRDVALTPPLTEQSAWRRGVIELKPTGNRGLQCKLKGFKKRKNEQTESGLKRRSEWASWRTWCIIRTTNEDNKTKKTQFQCFTYLNQAIFCTNTHSKVNTVWSTVKSTLFVFK